MVTAVTGATGHIGATLVRALLDQGRQVRTLIHQSKLGLENLQIETIQGDVTDTAALCRAFSGAEVVYHLAAIISLSTKNRLQVEKVNVDGTANVVDACIKCGVKRLVHFSSIEALSPYPLNVPMDEARPLVDSHRSSPYAFSKAAGERIVLNGIEKGLDAVILNPTAVIGPDDYQLSHLGEVLLAMARGKLPALVEGGFNWVDVRDVATGALAAEKRATKGERYLLSGSYASISDLARLTGEIMETQIPRFVCPTWLARSSAPIAALYCQFTGKRQLYTSVAIRALSECNPLISQAKAAREIGYHSRPLRETLEDTFRWFRKTGLLETLEDERKRR